MATWPATLGPHPSCPPGPGITPRPSGRPASPQCHLTPAQILPSSSQPTVLSGLRTLGRASPPDQGPAQLHVQAVIVALAERPLVLSVETPLRETSPEPLAARGRQRGADPGLSSDQPESPVTPPRLQALESLKGGQDLDMSDSQLLPSAALSPKQLFVKDGLMTPDPLWFT